MNTKHYTYVRAWGIYLDSYQYYIDEQVRIANQENAPDNAIYKRALGGHWVTFDEVTNPAAISAINFIIQQKGWDK